MRLGQEWVDAMSGAFKGDESCGCEASLNGKFSSTDSSGRDSIKVSGDLVWKAAELPSPIRRGPRTISGNWSFSTDQR